MDDSAYREESRQRDLREICATQQRTIENLNRRLKSNAAPPPNWNGTELPAELLSLRDRLTNIDAAVLEAKDCCEALLTRDLPDHDRDVLKEIYWDLNRIEASDARLVVIASNRGTGQDDG